MWLCYAENLVISPFVTQSNTGSSVTCYLFPSSVTIIKIEHEQFLRLQLNSNKIAYVQFHVQNCPQLTEIKINILKIVDA